MWVTIIIILPPRRLTYRPRTYRMSTGWPESRWSVTLGTWSRLDSGAPRTRLVFSGTTSSPSVSPSPATRNGFSTARRRSAFLRRRRSHCGRSVAPRSSSFWTVKCRVFILFHWSVLICVRTEVCSLHLTFSFNYVNTPTIYVTWPARGQNQSMALYIQAAFVLLADEHVAIG